jgi:transcriptional regulator GlxA family with amidase domain
LLQLIQQAQDSGAASSTCSQLGDALRSYFDSQIRAAGISLPSAELDPIHHLLSALPQRLSESLGLPDLADMVHLSPRRLQELTQDRLGCSPMELLRRLRLELLHRLLLDPAESGESLQVLLDRCRLPASNATRQAFQSLYGLTPSALRRQGHSPSPRQSLAEPA